MVGDWMTPGNGKVHSFAACFAAVQPGRNPVTAPDRARADQIAGHAVRVGEARRAHRTRLGVQSARKRRPIGGREHAVAVRAQNLVLMVVVDGDVDVVPVARQIAHAPDAVRMLGGSVAMLRATALDVEFRAHVGLPQADVDHARDRIGAVGRRRVVLQHIDAFDRVDRNRRHVDEAALTVVAQGIGHHALTVDERQRVAHRQTAQRDARSARREGLTETLAQGP